MLLRTSMRALNRITSSSASRVVSIPPSPRSLPAGPCVSPLPLASSFPCTAPPAVPLRQSQVRSFARASLPSSSNSAAAGSTTMATETESELHLPEIQQEEYKLPVHDPATKFRKDYTPTPYLIDTVRLDFILNEDVTHVHSTLLMKPNYAAGAAAAPALLLDGRKDITLVSIKVDGKELAKEHYAVTEKALTVQGAALPLGPYTLQISTAIKPQDNSLLEGLYKSGGNFCTQCEAEGFRGITYFLDRPDVMAKYTTRVEAAKSSYPVLLSNGNLQSTGDLPDGRHFATWLDPFPKPCYLFALVAGSLSVKERKYTTGSGKEVLLRIYVQEKDLTKVDFALDSLVKSMKWDEETYGLEYDLDLFNIVAVDDFNMGAMENKSLNIFNSKLVLASPETATDTDYSRIEGVVGHEYFHNWTGNRVTCRDWFQLTLKEGLTVFRDQEFSSDMNSRAVKLIEDVSMLRVAQFTEDGGPMAHPIRPDSYLKMDNFYTVTVYEKGAEVVRVYNTLLGKEGFRKGMDLYFKRHDGCAVTCDDFLAAMADANGADLSGMQGWYSQAGTPHVTVSQEYNAASSTLTLTAKQHNPPSVGQPVKAPVLIPLAVGLLGPDGKDLPLQLQGSPSPSPSTTTVLRLEAAEQSWTFVNVPHPPVLSALRGFSAPVKMTVTGQSDEDLLFMFAHDTDPFNRWESGQRLLKKLLLELYAAAAGGAEGRVAVEEACRGAGGVREALSGAFRSILLDTALDGSFKSMAVSVPSGTELLDSVPGADPLLLHEVRMYVVRELAARLRPELEQLIKDNDAAPGEPYAFNAAACARRAIKNKALAMLASLNLPETTRLALDRYHGATNMTDSIAALSALVEVPGPERQQALDEFYTQWKDDPLVILKWLGLQSMSNAPGNVQLVRQLVEHPAFNINNPNNCYSLFLGFGRSPVNFHAADGSGYEFLGEAVLKVDKLNHQVAARMTTAFATFRQFDPKRQALMKAQLQRIVDQKANGLSDNVFEVASKSLA